ncbi:MAG: hypothetical protein JW928_04975 [Candidatus Aureabacteria bacterium]|nr:hypothetical protein [Candidatus Auribacterota bacterium]
MESSELIPYLKQFIELEDRIAIKLKEFLSSIFITSDIDEGFKKEINEKLDILSKDGEKHIGLVESIEKYVEGSEKDEF